MTATNPISATIPFDQDGVHHGFLKLPHSHDDSAWGAIMIPLCVIKNGDGPTALLTGANHGDEYEGPIILQELAATMTQDKVTGRLIILPFFNYPAFLNSTRTSPLDGGNMNRSFPGAAAGTPTQKIAHYVQNMLLPLADIAVDFHSGGKTLDFVPFAAAHLLDDAKTQAKCFAAMRAFNAPYSVQLREIESAGMYDNAVEEMGKILVTTELGGGGTATAHSIKIARKGLHNVLIHMGILAGEMIIEPTIMLTMPDDECYLFAEDEGLFEMLIDLGKMVRKGDAIARIWSKHRTGIAPTTYHAKRDGILISRHHKGLINTGDCLSVIGVIGEAE